jgi:hypothetical protein
VRAFSIHAWDKNTFSKKINAQMNEGYSKYLLWTLDSSSTFNTSWWTQFKVLMHRSMKNSRSAIFTLINLIKSATIGLSAGLLWFQLPCTSTEVFNRASFFFFTVAYWVYDAMFGAFLAFPSERAILFKACY